MKTTYKNNPNFFQTLKKLILLSLVFSLTACDSFLEVDLPKSQLTKSGVFQDYTTANAAMADVYVKVRDLGLLTGGFNGLSYNLGLYADELDFYGISTNVSFAFSTNAVLPTNSNVALFWNNTYNQIYSANAVLEGVKASNFSVQQKAQLEGEALFIRALLHFYLLQLFGDIPYIRSTDYVANSLVTRMGSDQVYANITSDLNTAIALLLPAYPSTERVRPNSFVARALLARVNLYRGNWSEAEKMANSLIENTALYTFENSLDKVFLKASTETIWQFMPSTIAKNTDEATVFILTAAPPVNAALSESLINSFSSNDLRRSNWMGAISNAAKTWYYPNKYKERMGSTTSKEYSIVFRLTEQYLIRAEARAELGNLVGAKEDLNKIRTRAGLANVVATSKEEIMEGILLERRKELFTEHGHRFFDLKRLGKLNTALSAKPGWNSSDSLLPIPKNELGVNPNLRPQNPGY